MVTYKQHSFVGGIIDRALMGRQDVQKYYDSASALENVRIAKQGYAAKRRGTNYSCSLEGCFDSDIKRARLIPFSATLDQGYYLVLVESEAGTSSIIAISDDGILCQYGEGRQDEDSPRAYKRKAQDGWYPVPIEITKKVVENDSINTVEAFRYSGDEFESLGYCQSGDTVFIAHKNHPLVKIYRISNTDFKGEVVDITQLGSAEIPPTPEITSATKSGDEFSDSQKRGKRHVYYKVTAVSDGIESRPSEAKDVEITLPWQDKMSVTVTWEEILGAEYYNIYKKESSEYGLVGTTKDDNGTDEEGNPIDQNRCTFEDDYISPDLTITPPKYVAQFHEADKYPSCVAIYQQRMALASTNENPFTVWLSCVGDLFNFNEHTAMREDDAIEATIPATEFPEINHMMQAHDLVLFCENGMWVIAPLSGCDLTYQTITCTKQNSIGTSKRIPPIYCGTHIVSIDTDRRTVRGCRYSFANDGLDLQDLSIFSNDLFRENPIKRMAWRQNPDMTLWCSLEDGTCAAMVYMQEQNIIAWAHHTFAGGDVMDIAGNKQCTNGSDNIAILMDTERGYEVWHFRSDTDKQETQGQLCVDGALTFTATGNETLATGEVFISPETGETIAPENIEPGAEYIRAFPFESRITTVYPQTAGAASEQLRVHNLKKADFRLVESSPFFVVPNALASDRQYWQRVDTPGATIKGGKFYGYTGDVSATPAGINSPDGRVTFIHDGILPWCLTYFALDYAYDPDRGGEG